jgi:hypothetical protein
MRPKFREETPKKGNEPTTTLSFRRCEDRAATQHLQEGCWAVNKKLCAQALSPVDLYVQAIDNIDYI